MIPHNAFIQRNGELAALDHLTSRLGPALVLVYGRRRVGKTTLVRRWAALSGRPTFYWEAPKRATPDNCRTALVQELWRWQHPNQETSAPRFDNWRDVLIEVRRGAGDKPCNIILDELPWAVESDPSLPSYLKRAWDETFPDSQVKLIISGSHISAMESLMRSDAPLFGRLTGKLLVRPFPFIEIAPFVPHYSAEKRLAVYSILGGIPDYLRGWNDRVDLLPNIREFFISDWSPYRNEKEVLISDVLRLETTDYEAVLAAVGEGKHEADAIVTATQITSSRVADVLGTLTEVRLVERRIRASIPPAQHTKARYARYYLADPFLQFYYRFIAPHRTQIAQELLAPVEQDIIAQLRGFVGGTFEELCRTWTLAQARASGLPLAPEFVGSDWQGAQHQADVVAVNWHTRQVLVGEAKWEDHATKPDVLEDLQDRAAKVIRRLNQADPRPNPKTREPAPWTTSLMIFSRRGGTPTLKSQAQQAGVRILTFADIMRDLAQLSG